MEIVDGTNIWIPQSRVEVEWGPLMEDMSQLDLKRNIMSFQCSIHHVRDHWRRKKEIDVVDIIVTRKCQTTSRII